MKIEKFDKKVLIVGPNLPTKNSGGGGELFSLSLDSAALMSEQNASFNKCVKHSQRIGHVTVMFHRYEAPKVKLCNMRTNKCLGFRKGEGGRPSYTNVNRGIEFWTAIKKFKFRFSRQKNVLKFVWKNKIGLEIERGEGAYVIMDVNWGGVEGQKTDKMCI